MLPSYLSIFIYSLTFPQNGFLINNNFQSFNYHPHISYYNHNSLKLYSIEKDSCWTNYFSRNSKLMLIPVIDLSLMAGNNKNNFLFSSREGGYLSAHTKKFSFNISAYHNLGSFPKEIENLTDSLKFITHSGNGYSKNGSFYSWIESRGNIAYNPYSFLQFSAGNDKHFFGNGRRSLFLSDNSGAFPYFFSNLKTWHIQYISMIAFLKDIYTLDNNISYKRKYATFHYLSWNITPSVNIDLFESIVWKNNDSLLHRGFDINYLNPVIFMRPVEYSLGSTDNALLGIGLNAIFFKNTQFYSQFIVDEFYASEFLKGNGFFTNKYGMQVGIRDYNDFNSKVKWLLEFNTVRPYTYSHYNTMQNYGNYRQALAHPMGSNFIEGIVEINVVHKKMISTARFSYSVIGKDSANINYGSDIYKNYWDVDNLYGHYLLQGVKTKQVNLLLKTTYILKPEWNLTFEAGVVIQKQYSGYSNDDYIFLFFGLKTMLYNDSWFE